MRVYASLLSVSSCFCFISTYYTGCYMSRVKLIYIVFCSYLALASFGFAHILLLSGLSVDGIVFVLLSLFFGWLVFDSVKDEVL